jgi:hypothetical protein
MGFIVFLLLVLIVVSFALGYVVAKIGILDSVIKIDRFL